MGDDLSPDYVESKYEAVKSLYHTKSGNLDSTAGEAMKPLLKEQLKEQREEENKRMWILIALDQQQRRAKLHVA